MIPEQGPRDIAEFSEITRKSCLVSEEHLTAALQQFEQSQVDSLHSLDKFAKFLVEQDLLTDWQCGKLLSGRFKGFFHEKLVIQRQLRKDHRNSYYEAIDTTNGERVVLRASPQNDGKIKLDVVVE